MQAFNEFLPIFYLIKHTIITTRGKYLLVIPSNVVFYICNLNANTRRITNKLSYRFPVLSVLWFLMLQWLWGTSLHLYFYVIRHITRWRLKYFAKLFVSIDLFVYLHSSMGKYRACEPQIMSSGIQS